MTKPSSMGGDAPRLGAPGVAGHELQISALGVCGSNSTDARDRVAQMVGLRLNVAVLRAATGDHAAGGSNAE